jgi:hypothetical protein
MKYPRLFLYHLPLACALLWQSSPIALADSQAAHPRFAGEYRSIEAGPSMSVSLGADRSATVTEDAGNGAITLPGIQSRNVNRLCFPSLRETKHLQMPALVLTDTFAPCSPSEIRGKNWRFKSRVSGKCVKYFGASLLSVIRVFGRFSLRVFATVPTLVIITLCQGFGPPLLSSLLWDRIAHALFVTSYLIIVSLCVMLVITIAYDKYTGK